MTVVDFRDEQLVTRVEGEARTLLQRRTRFPIIARRLGYSESTLQRRLRARGTNLTKIIIRLRIDLARQNFRSDPGLSVTEVGWRLGYHESSSFSNAYKNWTGLTPKEIRREYRDA